MYTKKHVRIALITLLAVSIISSCLQKNKREDVVPIIFHDSVDTSQDDSICFARDILPIFKSNCAIEACHDAITGQEGIVFDSYQTFFYKGFVVGDAGKSQVYNAITRTTSRRMPPITTYPLDSHQIRSIKKWIDQGMYENSCKQIIDTNQFSFSKTIYPIIKNYCFGCHNDKSEHLNSIWLQTYEQIKTCANNGKLLGSIKHLNGYKAMPDVNTKMDLAYIRLIEKWIENNALNN